MAKMNPDQLRKVRCAYLGLKGLGFNEIEAKAMVNALKETFTESFLSSKAKGGANTKDAKRATNK